MQAPDFWQRDGALPRLLSPLGLAWQLAGTARRLMARPWRAPVPVICVGNLVAGGAGKTPVVLSLLALLSERGLRPAALTRGYGGSDKGPLPVDPSRHDAAKVGDEALLLAAAAPTWLAHDRADGAREAVGEGAEVLVLDDGFQNASLRKDLSLLVIDADYGFGNGQVMPAGPLRETPESGLARADAVVLLGDGWPVGIDSHLPPGLPVLRARLEPCERSLAGRRVYAFAGIGRPQKFFDSLRALGAVIAGCEAFPDHQPYDGATMQRLAAAAARAEAQLVTTAKDAARLGPAAPPGLAVLDVAVAWEDKDALMRLLDRLPVVQPTSAAT